MQLQENIALAPHTTFKIGGPARYFSVVKTLEDVKESLDFARDQNLATLILGGGSNMLVSDKGFDGLVIKLELRSGFGMQESGGAAEVTAGAGDSWDELVAFCVEHNLWGIENLSGIPGSVGGAVVQNIGAYGAALSQVLQSAEVLDTKDEEVKKLSNAECRFGYRGSLFKEEEGRYIVLAAVLALSLSPVPNISYKDLQSRFNDSSIDIKAIREAVLEIRKAKFPDLDAEGTAGSFFKNPIMSRQDAETLKKRYPGIPLFSMPETEGVKVPLAWLIDHVLHLHGTHQGGARLFEKQPLVIAASRGCSAQDVKKLAQFVQKKVFDEFKIKIEPEVKII